MEEEEAEVEDLGVGEDGVEEEVSSLDRHVGNEYRKDIGVKI